MKFDKHKFRSYKNEEGEIYVRISDVMSMLDKIPVLVKDETVKVTSICKSFKAMMGDLVKGHD